MIRRPQNQNYLQVERAVTTAFTAQPDRTFTIAELFDVVFPGRTRSASKYQVVVRAARAVAKRLGWIRRYVGNGAALEYLTPATAERLDAEADDRIRALLAVRKAAA